MNLTRSMSSCTRVIRKCSSSDAEGSPRSVCTASDCLTYHWLLRVLKEKKQRVRASSDDRVLRTRVPPVLVRFLVHAFHSSNAWPTGRRVFLTCQIGEKHVANF